MAAQQRENNGSETKQVNTDGIEITPDDTDAQGIDPQEEVGDTDGAESESLEARLEAAEGAAKEAHDRYLRVSAEFENFKKRTAREVADFRKYANESLIRELLPVVDNLERAIAAAIDNGDTNSFVEGVDLILKEILKVFDKFSVKPIEAVGELFDPTFHQAVLQEETDAQPENTILREFQKGYTIHDRLLRPTMVVVSKETAKEEGRDNPDPQKEDSQK